jgi:hypothetical protein
MQNVVAEGEQARYRCQKSMGKRLERIEGRACGRRDERLGYSNGPVQRKTKDCGTPMLDADATNFGG